MTPSARVQAAIDLLDAIVVAARHQGAAADTIIARYFKDRRYAGSKDRRAVRDLVYRAIRAFGDPPASGRAAIVALARQDDALAALFDGSPHGPAPMGDDDGFAPPQSPMPAALERRFAAPVDAAEQAAMLGRAPLVVRANPLRGDPAAIFAALADATPFDARLPNAIILPDGTAIENSALHASGAIEVQDAGSQMIVAACAARPGMAVIDLCAGAGGKTLALAADMGGEGGLIAADISRDRLNRLRDRAQRAGAANVNMRLLNPRQETAMLADLANLADIVLVDAPCSGSGTWRRNPEARWRITDAFVDRYVAEQARLLRIAAPLVKPGGLLVFATCSLFDAEGRDQAEAFLGDHPDYCAEPPPFGRRHGPGGLLTPLHDRTDGFYYALLRKTC